MSAGKSEFCPCGSNKKYKSCCLTSDAPKKNDLLWTQLHQCREGLIQKIFEHTMNIYGRIAIEEAWEQFHLWENVPPYNLKSDHQPVFMPWFFYEWTPDGGTEVNEIAPKGVPPGRALLMLREPSLSKLEVDYIEKCCDTGFSFYEIIKCWPGHGFNIKDILTGEFYSVVEKKGSELLTPKDIIFGKAVIIGDLTILEACSSFPVASKLESKIIDLRQGMENFYNPINNKCLHEYRAEIVWVYQQLYHATNVSKNPNYQ